MKTIGSLLIIVSFVIIGYGKDNAYQNSYSERMKQLAHEAETKPNDKTALHTLEKYTFDPDNWNRSYAYGYLGQLALRDVGGCQKELIPYFDKALTDADYGVRQSGVQAISNIGSPAVEQSFPTLLQIIRQGKEDDITWASIKAIGQLKDPKKAQDTMLVLFKTASTPPPEGTQDEAPQANYYALESIKKLSKMHGVNVIPELESLLKQSKSNYKERVAKTILELDSLNKSALKVVNGTRVQ